MHSSQLCPALEQYSESPLCLYDFSSLPWEPNEALIDLGNTSQTQLKASPPAQHHLMEQGSRAKSQGTALRSAEVSQEQRLGPLPCQGLHMSALSSWQGSTEGQGALWQSFSPTPSCPTAALRGGICAGPAAGAALPLRDRPARGWGVSPEDNFRCIPASLATSRTHK